MSTLKSIAPVTESSKQLHRYMLLTLLLLGFALRHIQLGAESLWYDETVSVYLAKKSVVDMLAHTAGDIHPPGYYFLLHLWDALTNPTVAHGLEFLYAWPSLFFGVVVIALLYALGRKLFNATTGLLAAAMAAIHPFHLWYSQEVRMYTLGAALGLLTLWSLIKIAEGTAANRQQPIRWLIIYTGLAAAGMYTLYYFVFLLIAINLIAFILLIRNLRLLAGWIAAQIGALLLWSPWLPVFYRQATNPPVPPWRVPWETSSGLFASITESFGALSVGQSPPFAQILPWAVLSVAILALFFYTKSTSTNSVLPARLLIILYVLVPILLIYLISYFVTPLYHVRYLFTYAAPFALISAVAIESLMQHKRVVAFALALLLFVASSDSLYEFWTNPLYRADDHRTAVADIAQMWRPGDLILVNAGWAYPPLAIYWPTESTNSQSALPPPLNEIRRLGDAEAIDSSRPILVRTGSIDGSASLGWGDPASDFFAISQANALESLAKVVGQSRTIWHYRIYDTVSDPNGVLRQQLEHLPQLDDRPYSGRDYLRVQRFQATEALELSDALEVSLPTDTNGSKPIFGQSLQLTDLLLETTQPDNSFRTSPSFIAGNTLYLRFGWQPLTDLTAVGANLSMSVRLYSPQNQDQAVAQHDESPFLPTIQWVANTKYWQTMALGIPVSAVPGNYSLEIVIYRQDNGEPLPLPDSVNTVYGQRQKLTLIEVLPPSSTSH